MLIPSTIRKRGPRSAMTRNPEEGQLSSFSGAYILVVEDDDEDRELLTKLLEREGYVVRSAGSASHARRELAEFPPDLVLMDFYLPAGETGAELCREYRRSETGRDVPVLFVTGSGRESREVFQSGGSDYILKPVETAELLARVEMHLAHRAALRLLSQKSAELGSKLHLVDAGGESKPESDVDMESLLAEARLAREEALAAREEAHRANAAKARFLARMSHEMRTPLNGVVGMAELLHDAGLEGEYQDYLFLLESAADELVQMVSTLLEYAEAEDGVEILHTESFSPRKVVSEVIRNMETAVRRLKVELSSTMDVRVAENLVGDPRLVHRVLEHFLNFAVRRSSGGRVELAVAIGGADSAHQNIRVTATDSGGPLGQGELDNLFTEFWNLRREDWNGSEQRGVGLPLARRLAQAMGGEVGAENVPDRGVRLWLEVDIALGEAGGQAADEDDNAVA